MAMLSVSTVALTGLDVLRFAEVLRRREDAQTSIELFFDTLPFLDGRFYRKYMGDFIQGRRLGVHCPMADCEILAEEGTLLYRYSMDRHKECLELAAEVRSPYMILHTNGLEAMDDREAARKRSVLEERVLRLAEIAKPYGCRLWVENVGFGRFHNLVADEDRFTDFILGNDEFDCLVDLGHAHVNGWDLPALLRKLAPKLRGLHIHDNDGLGDHHMAIGAGTIPWEPVLEAMKGITSTCEMILEYSDKIPVDGILAGLGLLKERL